MAAPLLATVAGLTVYTANALVGVLAWRYGTHFGRAHHILYAINFALAGLVLVLRPDACMLVVVLCLTYMPRTRPARPAHRNIAGLGQLAYTLALVVTLRPQLLWPALSAQIW